VGKFACAVHRALVTAHMAALRSVMLNGCGTLGLCTAHRASKAVLHHFPLKFPKGPKFFATSQFYGRSGCFLFLTDNDDGELPLLCCMVNGCGDLRFMSNLWEFKRRVAYANVVYDNSDIQLTQINQRTSSIRHESELPQL